MIPAVSDAGRVSRFFRGTKMSLWTRPARNAVSSGDWCEVFPISSTTLAITIGDACGHGATAHEDMIVVRDAVRAALQGGFPLPQVVDHANDVALHLGSAVPVTAQVALLHTTSRVLSFVNAGHPRPLLQTGSGSMLLGACPGGLPLGIAQDRACMLESAVIPANSLLIFYTDGVIERDRDAIRGERELALVAAHVHRFPYLNEANAIAHQMTRNEWALEDDAAILTLRVT